jgi:hypothetical protein
MCTCVCPGLFVCIEANSMYQVERMDKVAGFYICVFMSMHVLRYWCASYASSVHGAGDCTQTTKPI